MSRLTQARPAVRTALKGRMMLSGPPGSGKTRSGLIMATELAQGESILGIDTEKESMATYADDFNFTHLKWLPPYDPRELAETLLEAGDQHGVIIIDSLSHFWRAQGGTLDIAGGKFTGWKDARPAQEELVEAILSVPAHVIVAVRAKVEYTQEQEASGRHVVKKLGMASVQDDTLEYEMNIAVDLAMDHTAVISKTRTTVLPVGRAFRAGHVVELAEIYREWLAGGEPAATAEQITEVVDVLNGIESPEQRQIAKAMFIESFGRPDALLASKVDEALTFAKDQATGRTESPSMDEAAPAADTGNEAPKIPKAKKDNIHRLFGLMKVSDRGERLRYCATVVGHNVESTNDLTVTEADVLISHLKVVVGEEPPVQEAEVA